MIERSDVPCNGCTECCQKDLIILHPECGDDSEQYETMQTINPMTGKSCLALAHKPEGNCIYLGEDGCTIHDRAPAICREFDCRRFYLKLRKETTRPERRRMIRAGLISSQLLKEGQARLHTLDRPSALAETPDEEADNE